MTLLTCAALYLLGQLLFLINIQFPRGHNFDEFHYVPSAKQFLTMSQNQNWEHPPLGKLMMAAGIAIGEDRPFGWRLMSTVFGALTLVGMYLWGLAVFRDQNTALWVALITLVNQLLYVQARIGMLDTFMVAFLVWGTAFFCRAWDSTLGIYDLRRLIYLTGAMFGLATACKWFAIVPWFSCILLVLAVRVFQGWRVRFEEPKLGDWYTQDLWRSVRWVDWAIGLVVVPLLIYFLTFIPLFWTQKDLKGLGDLIAMQKTMWDGQLRVVNAHPYMSHWSDWPTLKRPIWYAFDKEGLDQNLVRGVILLGNPLVMWGGLVALACCLWGWLKLRSREAFLIIAFYVIFYGSWVLIPRKVSFYYYYYPAGMTLSLALAYVFHQLNEKQKWMRWAFLGAAFGIFVYFFPILAALKIRADSFSKWMWFPSWI